jgi:two-component system, OmpR family, response regulator
MRWIVISCLVIILAGFFCIPVTGVQPFPDYDKILLITMNYNNSRYSVSSMEVRYGRAPNLDIISGHLKGVILDSKGKELKSFSFQEPGTTYGDISGPLGEDTLIGYTETSSSGEMTITLPYLPDMQKFTLSDSQDRSLLASVYLDPPVAAFCADYPRDPDCLVPASPSTSAESYPGTVLVPAILFPASFIILAGIAVWTIRRRKQVQTLKKQVVLIVDDEPDIVNLIDIFLGKKGYATLNANSGNACLDILKEQIPDLILLDVRMEPMNGWQTLWQIKKNPDFRSIPVLMLTATRLTTEKAKQYSICIDDYITKPFQLEDLSTAIDSILERKQKLKDTLVLAKKTGIEKELFSEFATLTRRISMNKKILAILEVPYVIPVQADLETLDDMLVVDYINVKTRDYEKRVEQLRGEINSAFRKNGLPELSW